MGLYGVPLSHQDWPLQHRMAPNGGLLTDDHGADDVTKRANLCALAKRDVTKQHRRLMNTRTCMD